MQLTSVGRGNFTFIFILTNQIFRNAVSNGNNYRRFWEPYCLAVHRPWIMRKQALPKCQCIILETGTFNDIAVRTSSLALHIFSAHLVGSVLHVVDIQYQNEQPSTHIHRPASVTTGNLCSVFSSIQVAMWQHTVSLLVRTATLAYCRVTFTPTFRNAQRINL